MKGMTQAQAEKKYGVIEHELEFITSSIICENCLTRVWFGADLQNVPRFFRCPVCNSRQVNNLAVLFQGVKNE